MPVPVLEMSDAEDLVPEVQDHRCFFAADPAGAEAADWRGGFPQAEQEVGV